MTDWPPSQAPSSTETWTIQDLRDGDLIFCARAGGPLATLGKLANEPWRHVGSLLTDASGQLVVVETFGERFQHRPLTEFMTAYDTYGAARLRLSSECIQAANDWMSEQITEQHVYPWDDLLLAGLIAATERGIFQGQRDRVRSALANAAESCKAQMEHGGVASLTCSAFVQVAYQTVGGRCAIEHQRWRSGASWPPQLESLDAFFDHPTADLEMAFADARVIDLLDLTESVHRHAAGSTINRDQLGEFVRVIVHAIGGYVLPGTAPTEVDSDGRWVTPGDLWKSASVEARALLTT